MRTQVPLSMREGVRPGDPGPNTSCLRRFSLAATLMAAVAALVMVGTAAPAHAHDDPWIDWNGRECPSGRTAQVYSVAATPVGHTPNGVHHYWVVGGTSRSDHWYSDADRLRARWSFTSHRIITQGSVHAHNVDEAYINCIQ